MSSIETSLGYLSEQELQDRVFKNALAKSLVTQKEPLSALVDYAAQIQKIWGFNCQVQVYGQEINSEVVSSSPQLIIANHPGSCDLLLSVSALESVGLLTENLKLVVSDRSMAMYGSHLGREHFISAGSNPRKHVAAYQQVYDQFKSGGSVMMFPTGFEEGQAVGRFKRGIAYLLERLRKDEITDGFVTALYIDPSYQKIFSDGRKQRALAYLGSGITDTNQKEREPVKVELSVQPLAEWLEIIDLSAYREHNLDRIQQKYLETFEISQ